MSLPDRFREICHRRRAARATRAPLQSVAPPAPRRPAPPPGDDLLELEAQARYHRDRLALYRARVVTARPASLTQLRDLQRASEAADERLRHARRSA